MGQNHTYRVQRGRILKILYKAFPDGVHKRVLALTLDQMNLSETDGVLRGHCDYLAGKGYIEIREDGNNILEYTARLTPKGIDLLEENIDRDPGIEP